MSESLIPPEFKKILEGVQAFTKVMREQFPGVVPEKEEPKPERPEALWDTVTLKSNDMSRWMLIDRHTARTYVAVRRNDGSYDWVDK